MRKGIHLFICLLTFHIYQAHGADDVGVIQILSPSSSSCFDPNDTTVTVTFLLKNFGEDRPLGETINVSYQVNSDPPVQEGFTSLTFDSNEVNTESFNQQLVLASPGTYTIKVYSELAGDADNSNDTSTVTIERSPPTEGGNLSASDTVCTGDNRDTLRLTGFTGDIQQWEFTEDGGLTWTTSNNTDSTQVYENLTTDRQYRVQVESGFCPEAYSDTVTITVDPQAIGGTLEDDVVCSGMNGDTLRLQDYFGGIVKWQIREAGGSWTDTAHTADTFVYQDLTITTHYRVIVDTGVCPSDTSSVAKITVVDSTIPGTVVEADSACAFQNGDTLHLTGAQGDVLRWEKTTDGGASWTNLSNTDTLQPYADLTTTTTYRALVQSGLCPSKHSGTATIMIYSLSDAGVIDMVCDASNAHLHVRDQAGTVTSWHQKPAGEPWRALLITDDTLSLSDPNRQNATYKVAVQNEICPADTSSTLFVPFLPVARAGKDTTISLGEKVRIGSSGSAGISSYVWQPAGTLNNPNVPNPVATPEQTTRYVLTITGNDQGCQDRDSVQVTVEEDFNFTVNNIITPNGDGYNDTWYIENIEGYSNCEVTIFNRNGLEVFRAENYQNDWAGTHQGSPLPDGTYYYVIQCPGNSDVLKGHVSILRGR